MDIQEETVKSNAFVEVEPLKNTKPEIPKTKNGSYFDGSFWGLLAYTYLSYAITAFSLGLLRPWGLCLLNNYIYKHTIISGKRLQFGGKGDGLFANMFKWSFLEIVTFGIYSIWVPTNYKRWEVSHLHFEDEKLDEGESYFTGSVGIYFLINLLCSLMTTVTFGILGPVAHVIKLKWVLEHTVINRKVVRFNGSAGSFFLKKIGWTLLTIVTFGIYGLWVPLKTTRWDVENTYLLRKGDGNVKLPTMVESEKEKKNNKIFLFVALGIVATIIIFVLIKFISVMGPVDEEIQTEMISTFKSAINELNYKEDYSNLDTSCDKWDGYKNIKKLDLNSLNTFKENGGKGVFYDFCVSYNDYGEKHVGVKIQLLKKSTVCTGYLSNEVNEYYSNNHYECESVTDYILTKVIPIKKDTMSNFRSLEYYEY